MIEIPYLRDFFKAIKKTSIDDVVDRICYFWTTLFFAFFAIFTGGRQTFGRPIECMMPAEFTGTWNEYVREYCYVSSTYYKAFNESWTLQEREERTVQGYYQWVPYILLAQAIMMYLPHLAWKALQSFQVLDFEHVVERAARLRYTVGDNRQKGINEIVEYLKQRATHQRSSGSRSYCGFGKLSSCLHIVSKIVTLIVMLVQLSLMNTYFGHGEDSFWGLTVFYNTLTNAHWNEDYSVFPRVTFCDFDQKQIGNTPRRTVQCVLMANMINEKIFVCAWLWLAMLSFLLTLNIAYSCIVVFMVQIRRRTIRFYLKPLSFYGSVSSSSTSSYMSCDDHKISEFADETLGADGVHLFRFIHNHAGSMMASQICCALYDSINCR